MSEVRAPSSRLSVYRHVLRAATAHGVKLREAHSDPPSGDEAADDGATFRGRVDALRMWCRVAEKLVLQQKLADAVVHAGFERLSRVGPVRRRYGEMAALVRSVDVYGEPDVAAEIHRVREVTFRGGPLANEWFLLVDSARFKTILAGDDLDGFGGGVALASRSFEAVACHHPAVVSEVRAALEEERDRLLAGSR